MAKVTMADVAREAKVNKATVSRALRGDGRISPSTRDKVWKAAKKLGYRVHMGAQGLSSSRTSLVGVALDDLRAPWSGPFLSGVEKVLSRYKMEMVVKELGSGEMSARTAQRRLMDRRVDGVIWNSFRALQGGEDVPSVMVGTARGTPSLRVVYDQEETLNRVLAVAGDRSVKYISGRSPLFPFLSALERPSGSGRLVIYDGDFPEFQGTKDRDALLMICADPCTASRMGCLCLDWLAMEAGVVSARGIMNRIRGKGMRARVIYLLPSVYDQGGSVCLE